MQSVGNRRRTAAFTLIEMLVVIGIIVVLVAMLFPVIAQVRISAREASTKAEMTVIASGMERYRGEWNAYPGPFSNSAITSGTTMTGNTGTITMTENGILGLMGGLQIASGNISIILDNVGAGPMNLSPDVTKQTRPGPYVEISDLPNKPYQNTGKTSVSDSQIPEFLDRMANDPLRPIIYMRANRGGTGIVDPDPSPQYQSAWLTPYTRTGDFSFGAGKDYPDLKTYLTSPNASGVARGKDTFFLVSAGADGIFGTKDDIIYGTSN